MAETSGSNKRKSSISLEKWYGYMRIVVRGKDQRKTLCDIIGNDIRVKLIDIEKKRDRVEEENIHKHFCLNTMISIYIYPYCIFTNNFFYSRVLAAL